MTLIKTFFRISCPLLISTISFAELVPITSDEMSNVSGQSGITMEGSVDLTIGDIAYQQTPDSSYLVLHDITAQYQYGPTTLDVTSNGALRFGLPEFINFDKLSMSLYNSKTVQVDANNPNNIQTYTIYADTLGNAYDRFDLDITGTTFDNGNTNFNGDYVNTGSLEGNRSTTLTVTEATDIKLTLVSDDDCTSFFCDNQEDFANIVIVDEDGNIVAQEGQSGQHDATLNYSFDSPINNNFLVRATLTGTFKMGGAIEMFGAGNVSYKR